MTGKIEKELNNLIGPYVADATTLRGPCMLYFRRSIYIWIDEKDVKICEKPQLRRLKTNGSFRLGGLSQRAKGASYQLVTSRAPGTIT